MISQGDKMLNFKKLSKVYFSPSESTEKIVNEVAKNFNMNRENYTLLSFDDEKIFNDELVITSNYSLNPVPMNWATSRPTSSHTSTFTIDDVLPLFLHVAFAINFSPFGADK